METCSASSPPPFSRNPSPSRPRAMRLDDLLKELAAQTGERYKVAGTMAARIVLVAGPARPAESLRKDLAAATWGKWSRDAEKWTLDEDKAAVAAARARNGWRAGSRR